MLVVSHYYSLCTAHVGVAMGDGAALSMEKADVTLLDSNLEKMEYSIRAWRESNLIDCAECGLLGCC